MNRGGKYSGAYLICSVGCSSGAGTLGTIDVDEDEDEEGVSNGRETSEEEDKAQAE